MVLTLEYAYFIYLKTKLNLERAVSKNIKQTKTNERIYDIGGIARGNNYLR